MNRFYTENLESGTVLLTGSERDHCVRVLRTRIGDSVEVVDGRGHYGRGVLESADKRVALVRLEHAPMFHPKDNAPEIAIAVPKNRSRWEYFLEKAVETGVGAVIPLLCRRSEKEKVRMDRSRQIMLSAFKQSLRYHLPELREPIGFDSFVNSTTDADERFIAYCAGTGDENPFLGVVHGKGKPACVLIGPEGDFTEEEITLALADGFQPVSLGPNRLRVETAGITAINIIRCIDLSSPS